MKRLVLALLLVACSSSKDAASSESVTMPSAREVTVRLVVAHSGFGCTSTSPIGGNGSRLTAKDENGTTIGVGTFALTPDADSCDWTATLSLPDAKFVGLEGDRGKLASLSREDLEDGTVTLQSDVFGQISLG